MAELDAEPGQDLRPRGADAGWAPRSRPQPLKGTEALDRVVEGVHLFRHRHTGTEQLHGQQCTSLEHESGGELAGLELLSGQVLHQLPRPALGLRQGPGQITAGMAWK